MREEHNQEIRPCGLGGWLILIPVGLMHGVFRMSHFVLVHGEPFTSPDSWSVLLSADSPDYHPLLLSMALFELLASVAFAVYSAVLLWLFFRRSSQFPRLFIVYLGLSLAYYLVDRAVGLMIPAAAEELNTRAAWVEVAVAVVIAAIWIPYIILSRRVKNTFSGRQVFMSKVGNA